MATEKKFASAREFYSLSQLHDHYADLCFSQDSALCRMLDHGYSTPRHALLICSTKTEITKPNVQTKSPLALNCCIPVLFLG